MAKVLNGWAEAGDLVAYATRQGSWMTMNIGVVELEHDRLVGWGDSAHFVRILKVRVIKASDGSQNDRIRTLDQLDRVVKL